KIGTASSIYSSRTSASVRLTCITTKVRLKYVTHVPAQVLPMCPVYTVSKGKAAGDFSPAAFALQLKRQLPES
ncbi:hypothetical protein, partial [Collimonas sp.]|uniref:hypothetical protein n=1 Tax=Collimonas sp. TaxID=1963772 RepID=UPI002C61BA26